MADQRTSLRPFDHNGGRSFHPVPDFVMTILDSCDSPSRSARSAAAGLRKPGHHGQWAALPRPEEKLP
jgi:hypothetical protein